MEPTCLQKATNIRLRSLCSPIHIRQPQNYSCVFGDITGITTKDGCGHHMLPTSNMHHMTLQGVLWSLYFPLLIHVYAFALVCLSFHGHLQEENKLLFKEKQYRQRTIKQTLKLQVRLVAVAVILFQRSFQFALGTGHFDLRCSCCSGSPFLGRYEGKVQHKKVR